MVSGCKEFDTLSLGPPAESQQSQTRGTNDPACESEVPPVESVLGSLSSPVQNFKSVQTGDPPQMAVYGRLRMQIRYSAANHVMLTHSKRDVILKQPVLEAPRFKTGIRLRSQI